MKLKKVSFYTYSLPLIHPLNMKGYLQWERQGLVVELTDELGNKGYGDAAPFSGLHQESLKDILDESTKISSHLYTLTVDDFSSQLEHVVSPSLHFALDWAFVDLLSKNKDIVPAFYLNKNSQTEIVINALLAGESQEILESAKIIKDQNPPAVKVKVGGKLIEKDIILVQRINEIFEGRTKLRLDANRKWSLEQAKTFAKGIADTNIEFIEEPLNDPLNHKTFYENTGIRYALDETLTDCSYEDIKTMTGLAAFIIKPSVFGSIKLIRNWIDFAEILNVNIIFSSAFESSVGLWSIAQMAAAFSNKNVAHGLDTYRWLKQDIFVPPFRPLNFRLDLQQNPGPFSLKMQNLTPVFV